MAQNKLSNKQMMLDNFLSHFHFQIAHTTSKKNLVVDALLRRPMVNALSIAHNHDFIIIFEEYVHGENSS